MLFTLVGRLSCLENVLIGGLGQLRLPRYGALTYPRAMRAEALVYLDRVGLADYADRRADTLSGGHQQRVAIARTLMQKPGLLQAIALAAVIATILSAWSIEFFPTALVDGLDEVAALLQRMVPPRLDDPGRIGTLGVETLLMAVLGTAPAAIASVPLAFMAARTTTPHPAVYPVARGIITFCRAMPDLLFAVLLVRGLGIGVLPGILALDLHSVGMLAKLFADAIEEIDHGPLEVVRSVGGGWWKTLFSAVIPQSMGSDQT